MKILAALKAKYPLPQWAFFSEVSKGVGASAGRRCDGMAFGIWPSSGQEVFGFEIKASRSDWLREIQDPAKAEAFAKHCDRWWIVATKGIVKLDELPALWGLMELVGNGLRIRRPAAPREAQPIPMQLMLSLLRKAATEAPGDAALKAAELKGYGRGAETKRMLAPHKARSDAHELKSLRESVAEFEDRSGVEIKTYGGGRIGDAVRIVLGARIPNVRSALTRTIASANAVQREAERAIAELKGGAA